MNQALNRLDEIRSILEIYVRFKTHSAVPVEQVQDMVDILRILDLIESDIEDIGLYEMDEETNCQSKVAHVVLYSLDDELKFEALMEQMKSKTLYETLR